MQFGSNQNPFLMGFIEQANKFAKEAGDVTLSQGWQNIQRGRAAGDAMGDGPYIPTTEELENPNFRLDTGVGGGIPASQYRGSNLQGTPEQQAEEQRISQTDPDAEAGRELMAMKQDEDVSFGSETLSKYKPKDEVIDATREEIEKRKALSPEERIDYNTQIAEKAIDYQPPKGRKLEPFEGIIGFENAISIEGPIAGGLKVKEISEQFSEKTGQKVDRKMVPADDSDEKTFDATIFNLEKASNFVKRNPQLRKIIEVTGGDLTRIDIEDFGPKDRKGYKAFVDGVDMGELSTEDNFNEKAALELLIDAPYVLSRNGYKVINGEKQPQAEGASVQQGMPAAQPPETREPIAETEPLRQQLAAKQAEESKKTAAQRQKRVTEINKEIEKLQVGTIDKPTGITRMDIASIARPTESRTTTKTSKQIERDIAKIEQLVAERDRLEGKVPATAPTQTGFTIRKIN
jgi:hypothetical protein